MPERQPPQPPEISSRRGHHTQAYPLPGAISGRCADCGDELLVVPVGGVCRDCARAQDTHAQHGDPFARALAGLRRGEG